MNSPTKSSDSLPLITCASGQCEATIPDHKRSSEKCLQSQPICARGDGGNWEDEVAYRIGLHDPGASVVELGWVTEAL
jgi:hypothetical protein